MLLLSFLVQLNYSLPPSQSVYYVTHEARTRDVGRKGVDVERKGVDVQRKGVDVKRNGVGVERKKINITIARKNKTNIGYKLKT
jgi:hypothetical protein